MPTFEHFCYAAFSLTLRLTEVGIYKRKMETSKKVIHLKLKIKEKRKENFFLL